jgi:hypothetical protein
VSIINIPLPVKILFVAIIGLFIANLAFCQSPEILNEPGVKKLGIFLGTWRSEITGANDQYSVNTCRWSANGKYLICDQLLTNGKKKTDDLAIYSYNPAKNDYQVSLVGIPGGGPFSIPVTFKGDDLIYTGAFIKNGKKIYDRTINTFLSSSYYTYKVQASKDSTKWKTLSEGVGFKTGG